MGQKIKFVFISINRIISRFAQLNLAIRLNVYEDYLHALFSAKPCVAIKNAIYCSDAGE
jgi:hypothetical protein